MHRAILSTILIGLSSLPVRAEIWNGERDLVVGDFEGESYDLWTSTGDAFGDEPARGNLATQMPITGFQGKRLANSFHGGDDSTGTLASPAFTLSRTYISFLIGGGRRPGKLELQLVIDGQVVRRAFGSQDKPGGTEALEQGYWSIGDLEGRTATVRIIDQAKGGWGHLNVDHIVATDKDPSGITLAPVPGLNDPPRQPTCLVHDIAQSLDPRGSGIFIPIRNGAPKRVLTLMDGDSVLMRNEVELADDLAKADWDAVMNIAPFKKVGAALSIHLDRMKPSFMMRTPIFDPARANAGSGTGRGGYDEPLRAQYHFSSARGWLNDPNGCVFHNGEYHLFYQHNPYGITWGNMHWGHAVSTDLVHWRELGDALFPDESGMMYSGSAVVDWKNTSGLGRDGKPPLILFYTAAGDEYTQCMAWSTDGRTFTKYAENPILRQVTHGNRDPKVIWHEPTKQWVMAVYVELKGVHTIHFYTSPDLKTWTYASKTDGFFECPDLFELPVDGDPAKKKWILTAASSEYQIGGFDGKTFTPETPKLPGHRGKGFYAAQSFSDVPDGRRIFIGWWQTETKGMPFNQSMSLPLELGLVTTADGPRLTFTPVKELEKLRGERRDVIRPDQPYGARPRVPLVTRVEAGGLHEVRVEFEPTTAGNVILRIGGSTITYDVKARQFIVHGQRANAPLIAGRQRLTIYCDRTGIEIFASDGQCYMPVPVNIGSDPQPSEISVESDGGDAIFHALQVHELRSAWR
ncbi:glycoside hydrolase family 32 protein [Luteolibacter ambystomatis]|uniref:Glycoside hydrolase family 32 protein n=1 Tax=Luteolibacter ambystomatis TaxID=2824561 RepID=A0A975J345_9BACT|nr:glycoside hydrolase family 32 protein [Luteolibacter ambystomatis]QUE53076.1 glycoside hydrolase family 32 protein [Luteolibacter ambystomatis]